MTCLDAKSANVVNLPTADCAIEHQALYLPFEIGFYVQKFGSQHLHANRYAVVPVETGSHRLIDDRVRVRSLLGYAFDRPLNDLSLVLPHARIVDALTDGHATRRPAPMPIAVASRGPVTSQASPPAAMGATPSRNGCRTPSPRLPNAPPASSVCP